jgi:hypothetical protein
VGDFDPGFGADAALSPEVRMPGGKSPQSLRTSDCCACSMSHCLGLRVGRSIGKGMVPLSCRHEPVSRIHFSGQQRQSQLSLVARDRRSAGDSWRQPRDAHGWRIDAIQPVFGRASSIVIPGNRLNPSLSLVPCSSIPRPSGFAANGRPFLCTIGRAPRPRKRIGNRFRAVRTMRSIERSLPRLLRSFWPAAQVEFSPRR